jgi:hypothetical protein
MKLRNMIRSILTEAVRFGSREKSEVMRFADDFRVGFEFEMHLKEEYFPDWADRYDYQSIEDFKESDTLMDYMREKLSFDEDEFHEKVWNDTESSADKIYDYGSEATVLINLLRLNQQTLSNLSEIVYQKDWTALENTDEMKILLRIAEVANELEDFYDFVSITTDVEDLKNVLDDATSDNHIVHSIDNNSQLAILIHGLRPIKGHYTKIAAFFEYMKDLGRILETSIFEPYNSRHKMLIEEIVILLSTPSTPLVIASALEGCQDFQIDTEMLDEYFRKISVDSYIEDHLDDEEIMEIAISMNVTVADETDSRPRDDEFVHELENLVESSNLHGRVWRVDSDSSVSTGGEIVTEPLPLDESLEMLYDSLEFIQQYGRTSSDTGLHVNISINTPGFNFVVDPLKLMLLMDSKHMEDQFQIRNSMVSSMLRGVENAKTLQNAVHSFVSGGFQELVDYSRKLVPPDKHWQINFANMYGNNTSMDGLESQRRIEFRFPGGANYEFRSDEVEHHVLRAAYMLLVLFHGKFEEKDFIKSLYRFWNNIADHVFGVSFDRLVASYKKNKNLEEFTGEFTIMGFDNQPRRR